MTAPPLKPEQLAAQLVPDNAFELIRQSAQPATSEERDTVDPLLPMNVTQDLELPELDPEMKAALTTLYGADFPLLNTDPSKEEDWVSWVRHSWDRLGPGVQRRLHLTQRNRLFKQGIQWISSTGFGPWREPPRPRESVKVVENMIGPALNQRVQIIAEQRPGFRVRPSTSDQDDLKRAEAKQLALEYQYDQQEMEGIIREAAYWSGTDGVSFLELYWDPDAGPWHEEYVSSEDGADMKKKQGPLGDVKTRVRRIEQVRVSANATANRKPWFWVIHDVMSKQEAIRLFGVDLFGDNVSPDVTENLFHNYPLARSGYQLPNVDELLLEQEKVSRFTVYCEKSLALPKGLTLVVVGDKLVYQGPLLIGTVPMVRWPDGSPDPSFYPAPEMDLWIDSQMRVNAIKTKWVENVRVNSGPKLLAKENSISPETMTSGNMTVISAKGLGGLSEIVKTIESFSVGDDAKELLAMEKKVFEDLSGWNDTSRGSLPMDNDQSGRAILAIREQLERIFAPMVNAGAKSMTEWAKISCSWMAWGYDIPRNVGVEGRSRPDLTRALMADDFDGVSDIFIDPETLMPMPRPLRLFLLKDLFQQGMMSMQEYRRRLPFAWTRSIGTPDEDHEARAKRCAEGIRNGQILPVLWQDNEAIHQDVLERELILPDDIDPMVREMAIQRWTQLAMQAQAKMGVTPPLPQQQGKPSKGQSPGAAQQPFGATNPGIAAQTTSMSNGDRAVRQFDSQQRSVEQQ